MKDIFGVPTIGVIHPVCGEELTATKTVTVDSNDPETLCTHQLKFEGDYSDITPGAKLQAKIWLLGTSDAPEFTQKKEFKDAVTAVAGANVKWTLIWGIDNDAAGKAMATKPMLFRVWFTGSGTPPPENNVTFSFKFA